MRVSMAHWASSVAVGLALAFGAVGAAHADSVMRECAADWKQAKASGSTNGETWQQFLAQCRTQKKGGAASAATTAPSAAPVQPAATATTGKTASECNAEYAANKAAIKADGQSKRDFVAACRAGTGTAPTATQAAAPAPAPIPTPVAPATPSRPGPVAPKPRATPTGAGGFATDAQARGHCPTDTVVWVNTKSGIYHFAGTHNYGTTKQGAYMCEADAKAAGDRAAENERHP